MVRINIIDPAALADQHLIAEYNETLMLLGYVRKYPVRKGIPKEYLLGKGHITFFKDKLLYLERRFNLVKEEMRARGFKPEKAFPLHEFPKELHNDWEPKEQDKRIIKARIIEKLRKKPTYYRHRGAYTDVEILIALIEKAT